jgi:hypothetical protein
MLTSDWCPVSAVWEGVGLTVGAVAVSVATAGVVAAGMVGGSAAGRFLESSITTGTAAARTVAEAAITAPMIVGFDRRRFRWVGTSELS